MTGAQARHLEALSAESPLLARVNLAILKAGGKMIPLRRKRCAYSCRRDDLRRSLERS